ncbi:hypothetical protein KF7HA_00029 [Lactococcus lactis]|nr:hypothetical protein [Lactococcus lactis]
MMLILRQELRLLKKYLNILRRITVQKGFIQVLITSLQKTLKNIILKFS